MNQPKELSFATHIDGDGVAHDWNPEAAARCIQFVDVGILDVLYVPVNDKASHWQLVVVDFTQKVIYSMDPYHVPSSYGAKMLDFLIKLPLYQTSFKFDGKGWEVVDTTPHTAAKQDGGKLINAVSTTLIIGNGYLLIRRSVHCYTSGGLRCICTYVCKHAF